MWVMQLSICFILTLLFAVILNSKAAISALLGGLVCIIPNAYFAIKLFQHQGARSARKIVNGFYKGEALKLLLSFILFTAVFIFCKITPLAFFTSYILILMTHWFAPWIIDNKHNRPESD